MSQKITEKIEPFIKKLIHIWDDIGIGEEQQNIRQDVVLRHIGDLLEEMVSEEESLRRNLKENTEKYSTKLAKLCKEMDLSDFVPQSLNSLVMRENELRNRYEVLEKEKHDRLSESNKLTDEDRQLCKRMNVSPLKVKLDAVPKSDQLMKFKALVEERKQEVNKRQQNYDVIKDKIISLIGVLNQVPETKFEQSVIHQPVDWFTLSTENMTSLKEFCDRLELQLQDNKRIAVSLLSRLKLLFAEVGIGQVEQNAFIELHPGFSSKTICALQEEVRRIESLKERKASDIVKDAQKRLKILWDKCFYSQEQRDSYQHLCQCDYKIINVEDIMKEIERVQSYYDAHKITLDKINRYQETFREFVQVERKALQPDHLYVGSSNFLLEEKARSRLAKEIAGAEQDALSAVELWEKQTGRLFLVNGSRFKDYVKNQWQEFKAERAEEQIRQLKAKVEQSEPITPGKNQAPLKRHLIGATPGRVASKLMKFDVKGTQSAPHSQVISYSPRQRWLADGGVFVAREPKGVAKSKHLDRMVRSPLLASKNTNHGCLFASVPEQSSSEKASEGENQLYPSSGTKTTAAKRRLWTADKPSCPSAKHFGGSENINPTIFDSKEVASGIQPICSSEPLLNVKVCEVGPAKPSYQEFMEGLSDSGKKNFCSSILSSQ